MTPSTIVSESPEALAERAAADFAQAVGETLKTSKRFTFALSGGVTPKLFFNRLRNDPYRKTIPWEQIWFFWGDERCVGPDHSESNFRMARENLLEGLPVSSAHVFRIRGEDPPAVAARDYEKVLHETFGADAEWPTFDLILLGLGPDGHTASLMPGTSALQEEKRWVVENVVRSLQTVRITLTLPAINYARRVWFLATGFKKHAAFTKAQAGPNPDCPASLVHPPKGELRWYIDKAVIQDPRTADRGAPVHQPRSFPPA
jgi:6-phosphogluconolactonase